MPAMGTGVDLSKATKGIPPVILQVQSESYITLQTPEDIKQWEEDVKNFYGISLVGKAGHACETCSSVGSDDCGILK